MILTPVYRYATCSNKIRVYKIFDNNYIDWRYWYSMRLLFLIFPEIAKLNTREMFCNHQIVFFFSITKYNTFNLDHTLKTDGAKLFKDLLTNKIFSKEVLSWIFKVEFCLNRGLVWEFLCWKLIILTVFFCKLTIRWIVLQFWTKKDNSKISRC